MKPILFFLLITLLTNCRSISKTDYTEGGKPFFEYDTIDHYCNNIDETESPELFDNYEASPDDSIRTSVITGNTPTDLNDLGFIDKLEAFGYHKQSLSPALFKTIDSVFVEKVPGDVVAYACIYVYRDILVFKKKGKITGTAKICFHCNGYQFNGTDANTQSFGQEGDYKRLEKALHGAEKQ